MSKRLSLSVTMEITFQDLYQNAAAVCIQDIRRSPGAFWIRINILRFPKMLKAFQECKPPVQNTMLFYKHLQNLKSCFDVKEPAIAYFLNLRIWSSQAEYLKAGQFASLWLYMRNQNTLPVIYR